MRLKEGGLRLPVDDNDDRVAPNCAALMSRAVPESMVDAAAIGPSRVECSETKRFPDDR
jgi:hypothetical protein